MSIEKIKIFDLNNYLPKTITDPFKQERFKQVLILIDQNMVIAIQTVNVQFDQVDALT